MKSNSIMVVAVGLVSAAVGVWAGVSYGSRVPAAEANTSAEPETSAVQRNRPESRVATTRPKTTQQRQISVTQPAESTDRAESPSKDEAPTYDNAAYSPSEAEHRWTTLPALPEETGASGKLAEAIRWFDSLSVDKQIDEKEMAAANARLAAAGFEMSHRECRQNVCRLSFTYSKWDTFRSLPRPSAQIRPTTWSFTEVTPDGKVQGHVFIVSNKLR